MDETTPKKGKAWLADKLAEGASRLWHEPETTRFERGFNAHLRTADNSQRVPSRLDDDANTVRELRASDLIELCSIRLRAIDKRSGRKRRIMETRLEARTLQRIVVRHRPSRDGIGHDRYSIVMQFLTREGVAMRDGSGYKWTPAHSTIKARADWLVALCRSRGEVRTSMPGRYVLLD